MDMYMFPNPKRFWGKPPDPPSYKRWSIYRNLSYKIRIFALRDKRSLSAAADYPEESSDEPANIIEISLDIADELKITIKKMKCRGYTVIKYASQRVRGGCLDPRC
jgi:hypothetical protein